MESEKKILIVDDIFTNRYRMSLQLKQFNCNSILAADGVEALEIIEKENIHIVLLDIEMPRLNGYETLQKIRTHHNIKKRNLPIIALTAHDLEEISKNSQPFLFNHTIQKPISLSALENLLISYNIIH